MTIELSQAGLVPAQGDPPSTFSSAFAPVQGRCVSKMPQPVRQHGPGLISFPPILAKGKSTMKLRAKTKQCNERMSLRTACLLEMPQSEEAYNDR
jgi:hypothetical protein